MHSTLLRNWNRYFKVINLASSTYDLGLKNSTQMGSGSGIVGRAVASDTGDPRFESNHRLYYLLPTA